jgi:nitrogen fixation NifU-like protein
MDLTGYYSREVLNRFRNPVHAGMLSPEIGVVCGQADTPGSAAVMQISLRIIDGQVREARFLAHGCPASIAAGSWLCAWLEGKTVSAAAEMSAAQLAEALALPPVKRHCAVLAEDALRAALREVPAN